MKQWFLIHRLLDLLLAGSIFSVFKECHSLADGLLRLEQFGFFELVGLFVTCLVIATGCNELIAKIYRWIRGKQRNDKVLRTTIRPVSTPIRPARGRANANDKPQSAKKSVPTSKHTTLSKKPRPAKGKIIKPSRRNLSTSRKRKNP